MLLAMIPSIGSVAYAAGNNWTKISDLEYTRIADTNYAINRVTYHEKQWTPGYWVGDTWIEGRYSTPYYTTSVKVTVTMNKTISGSYGRVVSIKLSDKNTLKNVVKGNKTSYSYTVTLQGKHKISEFVGKSTTVKVCTDSKGLIVGPASSVVKTKK